jgi:hypothetical protein
MDDIAAAAARRLHASAYCAAEDGLSEDDIFRIVREGIAEARRIASVRARSEQSWAESGPFDYAA